jgi:hypothetical protein
MTHKYRYAFRLRKYCAQASDGRDVLNRFTIMLDGPNFALELR